VGSSSALEKELITHFSAFLANCLGVLPKFGGSKWQIQFLTGPLYSTLYNPIPSGKGVFFYCFVHVYYFTLSYEHPEQFFKKKGPELVEIYAFW
jgi:hypothetical protein